MSVVEEVGPEGHVTPEPASQPYPYAAWADPLDARPREGIVVTVVKRALFVLVALNIFVLAGLVVFRVSGDDVAAPVLGGERIVSDDATPTTAAPPDSDEAVVGDDDADGSAQSSATPTDGSSPPPYPDRWVPTANEVQPDAKALGAAVAHTITNYDADSTLESVLALLPPVDPEMFNDMLLQVQAVHHPGMWSRGTVEYAQLGGHLDGRISIIVVIRQAIGADGSAAYERLETRTMEVRLYWSEWGSWELETIASTGGRPVERPVDLDPLAAAVVDHELIDLPDTGVWDIYNGLIDKQTLQVMLDLAQRTSYSVVNLRTGHAHNVYGTNRVSNHSVGRAVDIYQVGSGLVIDSHDQASQLYALSEWIVSRYDIREFGSPWKFPDAVAHTFTNEVHHDHIHIGVYRWPTSPDPPPTTTTVVPTPTSTPSAED